jgi:type IV secretory pathway VirB2 component (pilin)
MKLRKRILIMVLTLSLVSMMSVLAYASDGATNSIDMSSMISSGMDGLLSQMFAILAVVVPGVLVLLGATIAIRKGISLFRGLVSRG